MRAFFTIRDLRKLYALERHRIAYAIDRHGPQPAGMVGTTRIWAESDLPAIQASIDKVQANRQKRKAVAK